MAYRRNGLRQEDLFSVKLDGLTEYVKSDELEDLFAKYGQVQDVYIPRDYRTGKNKNFGFVRFQYENEAKEASEQREVEVDGQRVELSLATKGKRDMGRRDRSRGGGDRRRDSRGRGGRRDSRGRGRGGRDRRDSRDRGRGRN
ncbi:unnamed protein product [Amoebophrya sp. A25]|nr:unnamed protein product [Amoebophrya sp. A25]|eukprot:GSA25T00007850001.1